MINGELWVLRVLDKYGSHWVKNFGWTDNIWTASAWATQKAAAEWAKINVACPNIEVAQRPHIDDVCDHGVGYNDHHGCAECLAECADRMLDTARDGD